MSMLQCLPPGLSVEQGTVFNPGPGPIPQDIRHQRLYRQRRQAELVKLRQTLGSLHSKSSFHSEQVDYYSQYITTCLDNLTAKHRE